MPKDSASVPRSWFSDLLSVVPTLLSVAVIALLTLGAQRTNGPAEALDPLCLVCGQSGAADAVLNTLLFLPLGLAAARSHGWLAALLLGIVLSTGIETAQFLIPGRFPTVGDVVWNGTGAALGAGLWHHRMVAPSMPGAVRLTLAWSALSLPLGAAALLAPAGTPEVYFAQLAPTVSNGRSYSGEVLDATIADLPVPRGPILESDSVRAALRRGSNLRVRFLVTVPPARYASLFRFVDSRSNEIVSIAVRRDDLVWMERTVANSLAFRSAAVAWEGGLTGTAPGTEMSLIIHKEHGAVCMKLGHRSACGLGSTLSDGWQILMPDFGFTWFGTVAGALWLGVPSLLAGFLSGGALVPTLAIGIFGTAAVAAAAAMPWIGFAWLDALTVLAAILSGAALSRALRPTTEATRVARQAL